ncbi:MAG: LysM peptidoglycan-binding domain-containing protein [Anaerolineales bacterium]|nr:LysM peptidoglycan-binding domain-containing protein [Anaerolineales bacterium]
MRKITCFLFLSVILILFAGITPIHKQTVYAQEPEPTTTLTPDLIPITPASLIEAVNALRLEHGLNALNAHPVLMQVAQTEAEGIANGMPGHWRPNGLTLGQWLLSLGYPLSGDLSLDGYRSENWGPAGTASDAVAMWLSDDIHTNTMLSPYRSDIGAGIAGGIAVLETALQTKSGQMQYGASVMLTGIVQTQVAYSGMGTVAAASGVPFEYSVPVAVSTARLDGDVIHEVQYGQTLWTLAELYHVHIEDIKRLNGLPDDNIVPGWKLLIQKKATQPAPITDTPLVLITSTSTSYPTAIPFHTNTPSVTVTIPSVPLGSQIKQNSTVVAALLIAFSILLAGIIGFGKKKEV